MTSYSNAVEVAQDKMQKGEIDAAQANVLIVQLMGFRVIHGSLPASVRKALNNAVKTGELGHIKKEGLKVEVYHHKNGRANALNERERIFRTSLENMKKVFC